jgi:hypothetical protein
MRAMRVGVIGALLSVLALPAHAAVIGLLGGDYDPDAVNNELDPSHFNGFQCVFYDFADLDGNQSLDAITSIEFLLSGFFGEELFAVDPFSDLPTLGGDVLVPGSLRLSGGTITPNFSCEFECQPVTGLALYVGPDQGETLPQLTMQVVAVNGQVVVPEPATLMLLGPGVFGLLLARRRARTTRV